MELNIVGRNFEVTDAVREYLEKRFGKLDRYLSNIRDARVELSQQDTRNAEKSRVAQVTIFVNGSVLRAEERSPDIYASIDLVLDKIYRQIVRYKGKRQMRGRNRVAEDEMPPVELDEMEEEKAVAVVRRKQFDLYPMREEEAIEQMELLGHTFFVYYDADRGQVNVIYRRKDGNYGIIEPVIV
ncbi:MAG: ribosome-associated translation inhibitor RaiA [Chloroflexi bacterium]|nr:ribosome-associated translation inhibitor RaiA [Chloroflexota bacterium]